MRVTVLGMNGPYPATGGACSGYLLEWEGRRILFDAGPGILARLTRQELLSLEAVVLTHLHFDHCSDALAMRYALDALGKHVTLIAPPEPADVFRLFSGWGGMVPCEIHPGMEKTVAGMHLSFFPMRHPTPAFGVRAESPEGSVLAYTGDTNTCDSLLPLLRGADVALLDACFSDARWAESLPHLSARLAARTAAQAKVKRAILTHITPGSDEGELLSQALEEFSYCELAYTEMQIEV